MKHRPRTKPISYGSRSLGLMPALIALIVTAAVASASYGQTNGFISSIQNEMTVYNLCNQAAGLQASDNFTQARDLLLKAVSHDPSSYSSYAHLELAHCYSRLHDYQKTVSECQQALKFNPKEDDALYTMADAYFSMEKFDQAAACLRQYAQLSTDPRRRASAEKQAHETETYHSVTQAIKYMNTGRNEDATRLLDKVTAYDPTSYSAQVHGNLSFALERSGNAKRAIAEGKRALQFDPNDRQTVYNIGVAYEDIARFDDAIQWINRYVSMEPDQQQKQEALTRIKGIQDDKKQSDDPANKLPDYLEQMRKDGNDMRWAQSKIPLKVYLAPGAGTKGYEPAFATCILRSLDAWCEASGRKLNYTLVKDKKAADISVQWTNGSLHVTSDHPNVMPVGLTEFAGVSITGLSDAVISIRTTNPFYPDKGIEVGECASTCIHEVGHALGLGHSTSISDVMYFRNNSLQKGLPSTRDRATIARLYADFPAVKFAPHTEAEKTSAPIQFLPPPTFMPSKPPDSSKLAPPMFLPPPIKPASEKLRPPMFTPPPINSTKKSTPERDNSKAPNIPLFVPPPAK